MTELTNLVSQNLSNISAREFIQALPEDAFSDIRLAVLERIWGKLLPPDYDKYKIHKYFNNKSLFYWLYLGDPYEFASRYNYEMERTDSKGPFMIAEIAEKILATLENNFYLLCFTSLTDK